MLGGGSEHKTLSSYISITLLRPISHVCIEQLPLCLPPCLKSQLKSGVLITLYSFISSLTPVGQTISLSAIIHSHLFSPNLTLVLITSLVHLVGRYVTPCNCSGKSNCHPLHLIMWLFTSPTSSPADNVPLLLHPCHSYPITDKYP